MEPLDQKTETLKEVKERVRKNNRKNKTGRQYSKRLNTIIIISSIITIILIALILLI